MQRLINLHPDWTLKQICRETGWAIGKLSQFIRDNPELLYVNKKQDGDLTYEMVSDIKRVINKYPSYGVSQIAYLTGYSRDAVIKIIRGHPDIPYEQKDSTWVEDFAVGMKCNDFLPIGEILRVAKILGMSYGHCVAHLDSMGKRERCLYVESLLNKGELT